MFMLDILVNIDVKGKLQVQICNTLPSITFFMEGVYCLATYNILDKTTKSSTIFPYEKNPLENHLVYFWVVNVFPVLF